MKPTIIFVHGLWADGGETVLTVSEKAAQTQLSPSW